jgi:hypothetical protein
VIHFEVEPGNTIGLKDVQTQSNVILYPNPNKGSFNLKSDENISSVFIYDQYGRIVFEGKPNEKTASIALDVSDGVYIVGVILESGRTEQKRVVIN